MNPVRIMAHQSPAYAHDHWRFSGACAGVHQKAYLIQRFVNTQDSKVYESIRQALLLAIAAQAKRCNWKRLPAGTYDRLIFCAVLEHACAGPGWTARLRAKQCGLHVIEFRRYRSKYEFIYELLLDWLNQGHRQIGRNEAKDRLLAEWAN